jgi:hypothetical protein
VSPARRIAALILLAVAVLVLSIVILLRNRSLDIELLAVIGVLGGLAIAITALPTTNGNHH